ncbi:MAG TPA: ABC transporter ATP-binding protein [Nitrososphaeraceae archaeon]|jgi:NitT/TauT family transport system ATP-binding protein|nr:ABC transporter ATP-binding protein [Nitrososphaeraceae archaeon]
MYIQNEYVDRKISLNLKNVSKKYVQPHSNRIHTVLDNINIQILEGEIVTILGKSGCGKSTLLNLIAGFENSYGGEILLNGNPVKDISPERIMMFQESALFPWLTAFQNIEIALKMAKIPKDQREEIVMHYLEIVGLSDYSHSYIHQLSGGMKQRVSLARALSLNPKILLMDEPFAALDITIKKSLYQELLALHNKHRKTILFVTHNINEAVLLGDRVIVMSPQVYGIKKEYVIDIPKDQRNDNPTIKNIINQITSDLYENN